MYPAGISPVLDTCMFTADQTIANPSALNILTEVDSYTTLVESSVSYMQATSNGSGVTTTEYESYLAEL